MTLSLQYPLGFACLLGAAAHKQKIFMPSSYDLTSITEAFESQKSETLVCEPEVFESEVPAEQLDSVQEWTQSVASVIVGGDSSVDAADSKLFSHTQAKNMNIYLK